MNGESISPARWKVGDCIAGLYEVHAVHDVGGMGVVYKAHHAKWNEYVAIKAPRQELFVTSGQKQHFVRECETWIGLGLHPNIVTCYYVRTIDSVPHIFAEYVSGGTLHHWITGGCFVGRNALADILDIGIQFAWGLCHAHSKNVVHQDIKPGNVMMAEDGTPKITDFGLASSQPGLAAIAATPNCRSVLVSSRGMTPVYCSPEQAAGLPVTRKTDIWSWAVSILEMLVGEPDWGLGYDAGKYLRAVLHSPVTEHRLRVPASLSGLLRRCLRTNPDHRPESMVVVAGELLRIYQEVTGENYKRTQPVRMEKTADELNNDALSHCDLGNTDVALHTLKKAREIDPSHLAVAYNRALLQWESGQITDCEAIARLLDGDKDRIKEKTRFYFIGLLELERGRLEEARRNLEKSEYATSSTGQFYLDQVAASLPNSPRCVQLFQGHGSVVTGIRSLRNQQLVISCSEDQSLGVWNIISGVRLQTLTGHTDCVYGVAVLEREGLIISASWDGTLRVWSMTTGKCVDTLTGHVGRVHAVAAIDDLAIAVSGGDDCTVRTWKIPQTSSGGAVWGKLPGHCRFQGEHSHVLLGHANPIRSVCTNPNGKLVLSGDEGGEIRVWDLATGKCVHVLEGHADSVDGLCVSENGELALSGSHDQLIRVWRLDIGKCVGVLKGHTSWVCAVDISQDMKYAISGSEDHTVRLWELLSGRCLRTLEGHSAPVYSVCFEPSGIHCISASEDFSMRRWDMGLFHQRRPRAPLQLCRTVTVGTAIEEQHKLDVAIERAKAAVRRADIDAVLSLLQQVRDNIHFGATTKTRELYTLAARYSIRTNLLDAWFAKSFDGRHGGFSSLQISSDSRWLLSSSSAFTPDLPSLALWDLATGTLIRECGLHGEPTKAAEFISGTPYVLCVGPNPSWQQPAEDRHYRLILWDVSTGKCEAKFAGHTNNVWSVSLSRDGRRAISTSADKTLRLWDVTTGRCIRVFTDVPDMFRTVISPDGQFALSGKLRLWELSSGKTCRVFERESSHDVQARFSTDGRLAVTSSESYPDNTARLWDVSTGRCVMQFCGHEADIKEAVISGDQAYVLTASGDKTAKLWDAKSGNCIRTFGGHMAAVSSAVMSPDGAVIATASDDGAIRTWTLDWDYKFPGWQNWDQRATSLAVLFLEQHRSFSANGIQRCGPPSWCDEDVDELIRQFQFSDLGFIPGSRVKEKLKELAVTYH